MSESEGDKKRNKLGYQRISVACAHCRRRKIRCVMAEGDPHNRCQNCIRLNKECIFHPVEQPQGTSDSGSVAGSHNAPLSHSPRDLAAGQPFDARSNTYTRLAPLLSNAPAQLFTGLPYDSHSAHSTPHSGALDYRSQHFGDSRWPATEGVGASIPPQSHAPIGDAVDGTHGVYWNSTSDDYSSLGSANRNLSSDGRSYPFSAGLSADQQWQMLQQQQGRAMSFGAYEGQSQYAPHQSMTGAAIQQSIPHHSTFPIDTQSASVLRTAPGPHSAPVSGDSASSYQQTAAQHYAYQNPHFPGQQDMSSSWLSSHDQPGYGEYGSSDPADSSRRGQ